MWWKTALIIAAVSLVGWLVSMYALAALSKRPPTLGLDGGRLRPCPSSPNCVCSQHTGDAGHAIEPIAFTAEPGPAWEAMTAALAATPRLRVAGDDGDYLHAEVTSAMFGFVDDLELLMDRDAKVFHVRSASRVGRSDLGANRARVEALRKEFERR